MEVIFLFIGLIFLIVAIAGFIRNERIGRQFSFIVFRPDRDNIKEISVGDEVNLWVKPGTNQIYIYMKGSKKGNEAFIGYVPDMYSTSLIKSIDSNQDYIAEITQIVDLNVEIRITRSYVLIDQIRAAKNEATK
jgi:hypothetical protein